MVQILETKEVFKSGRPVEIKKKVIDPNILMPSMDIQ